MNSALSEVDARFQGMFNKLNESREDFDMVSIGKNNVLRNDQHYNVEFEEEMYVVYYYERGRHSQCEVFHNIEALLEFLALKLTYFCAERILQGRGRGDYSFNSPIYSTQRQLMGLINVNWSLKLESRHRKQLS